MKRLPKYDKIDLFFDQCFEKSLKERTRSSRGEGSQYLLEGDSIEIPYKMVESFLKINQNKNESNNYLSLKLLELHQGDHTKTATYKIHHYFPPSSYSDLDTHTAKNTVISLDFLVWKFYGKAQKLRLSTKFLHQEIS